MAITQSIHRPCGQQVIDLFVLNFHPNLTVEFSCSVSLGGGFSGTRTPAMMQRALFSRSALLAQQAAATLDSPLAARSAPLLQRLDRSMSSVTIPPPACMLRPLEAPLRYLFGPGPSNVPPRILAAGSRPIIGHLHPEMYEVTLCLKVGMSNTLMYCIYFYSFYLFLISTVFF